MTSHPVIVSIIATPYCFSVLTLIKMQCFNRFGFGFLLRLGIAQRLQIFVNLKI